MVDTQEIDQAYAYNSDALLETLHYLRDFTQEIGALAQRNAATDGEYSKAKSYINSEAAVAVGSRVAELVFTAATKTGVIIDDEGLPFFSFLGYTKLHPSINDSYNMTDGTPTTHLAGIAADNAQRLIAGEIADKGNRVYSLPVEDVAFRAGVISIRFLEALGAEIDHEQLIEALDENDINYNVVTARLTEGQAASEARVEADQDDAMIPIMEMLAHLSMGES